MARPARMPGICHLKSKGIAYVRHAFKWATSKELVPIGMFDALRIVEGLKRGRSAARETKRHALVATRIASHPVAPRSVAEQPMGKPVDQTPLGRLKNYPQT